MFRLRHSTLASLCCFGLLLAYCAGLLVTAGGCPQNPDDGGNGQVGGDNDNNGGNDGNGDGTTDGGGNDGGNDGNGDGTTDGGGDNGGNDGNGDGSGNDGGDGDGTNCGTDCNGGGDDNPPPTPKPTSVTLARLVQTGDPVPDQPAGTVFTYFSDPIVDADGRVAFWARYTGGKGDGGLYVWDDGTLKKVVDDNPDVLGIVPERSTTSYFGDFNITSTGQTNPSTGGGALCWGGGGRLLFVAGITSNPVTKNSRGLYRWRANDGSIVRVADMEQMGALFPDALLSAFACDFQQPAVSDDGLATFVINYTYITQSNQFVLDQRGFFTSNGVAIRIVADSQLSSNGLVPDQDGKPNVKFTSFEPLHTILPDGRVLFQASYIRGNGTRGVYLYLPATEKLVRVITNETRAAGKEFPGIPAGATLGDTNAFSALANGDGLRIAIDTKLTTGGATRDTVLYYGTKPGTTERTWLELTSTGGAFAAALLSGVNADGDVLYLADGRPHWFDGASARDLSSSLPAQLLGATITWADTGGAVNEQRRGIVPYMRPGLSGGTVDGLLMWTGEQLLLVADPAADQPAGYEQISTIVAPERDRPGRSGMFSDRDEVAFRALDAGADGALGNTDDLQAIFVGKGQ